MMDSQFPQPNQPPAPQGMQPQYSPMPAQQVPVQQVPVQQANYSNPQVSYQTPAPAPAPAPAVKPKKGWGMMFLALVLVPLFVVGELIGLYVGDATPLGEDLGAEMFGAIFMVVPCLILGGTKILGITKESWKFAWRAMWWSIAISAAIAILDLYDVISNDELILVSDWPWQFFLSIIFCICIGVLEEFMVRGLVLNGLLARMGTSRKGIFWACILSSLFFGLLHVDATAIGSATFLELAQGVLKVIQTGMYGFALAAVVCKTGELISVSLLHGLDDWLLFVLTFIMGESLETEYVSAGTEEGIATVIVYLVCIALYIPLVIRAIHTLQKIDAPNRGAFFHERKGAVPVAPAGMAAAAPAVAGAASVAPAAAPAQGYPVQQAPYQQVPVSQQAPYQQAPAVPQTPPVTIPTEIPENSLFRTDQSGAQGEQIPPVQ